MTRSERLGLRISRDLAEGTISDAKVLPIPSMRDDLDMEQRHAWHSLVGGTYFYLIYDDNSARRHILEGLDAAESFLNGRWQYRKDDEALWKRYQSSPNWSQLAIRIGYWAPVFGRWPIFSALAKRLEHAASDGLMQPALEHEFVWAIAAYEVGRVESAIHRIESITAGKGADGRFLVSAFKKKAGFEQLVEFLSRFHSSSLKEKNLTRKHSLVGGYVLHKFHPGSVKKLNLDLQDHVLCL